MKKKEPIKESRWGIVTQKPISLTKLAKEAWEPSKQDNEVKSMSVEEKREFLEAVAKFNEYGKTIYRAASLQETTEAIQKLIDSASQLTVNETEDWFDRVTVQRHMKQMQESYKVFEKTAKEISGLQQRLESCYEDIGGMLSKYYKINDIAEEIKSEL